MIRFMFMTYIYVFFFFKQKTAYEMRISDWSSDVCSSDLMGQADQGCPHPLEQGDGQDDHPFASREEEEVTMARSIWKGPFVELSLQIGRASCRERVCQYV